MEIPCCYIPAVTVAYTPSSKLSWHPIGLLAPCKCVVLFTFRGMLIVFSQSLVDDIMKQDPQAGHRLKQLMPFTISLWNSLLLSFSWFSAPKRLCAFWDKAIRQIRQSNHPSLSLSETVIYTPSTPLSDYHILVITNGIVGNPIFRHTAYTTWCDR